MSEWLNERAREMRQSIAALEAVENELTYAQLCWRPAEKQWSIGQIVEHLLLTDAPCLETFVGLLATAPRGETEWKPTIMGRLIIKAVEPQTQRKTRAGKVHLPSAQPAPGIVADYVAIRMRLLDVIVQSAGVDLNRVKTNRPIKTPLRYNLGDAFMILSRHTERHLQQIDRIRQDRRFPPGARSVY